MTKPRVKLRAAEEKMVPYKVVGAPGEPSVPVTVWAAVVPGKVIANSIAGRQVIQLRAGFIACSYIAVIEALILKEGRDTYD